MRTFLAAAIPTSIRNKIEMLIEEFKGIHKTNTWDKVKWVKPENVHITVYFFGEVNSRDLLILTKKLSLIETNYSPFEISIKSISAFPSPQNPRVIWCGIEDRSNGLKKANGFVKSLVKDNNLDIEIDDREYSPHLTIGRVKRGYSNALVEKIISLESRQFGTFTIDELILFSSTLTKSGPIYKEVDRYPFRGTD